MEYRFDTYSDLNGHPIGNLLLVALYNMTGSLRQSIRLLTKMLDIEQKVLPISEDYLTLMGETVDGEVVELFAFHLDFPAADRLVAQNCD